MGRHIDTTRETTELPDAEVCAILSNERRRAVLAVLLEADADQFALRDLAEQVAYREADKEASTDHQQSVYVSLHQTHLPKLDDHNIVKYDDDRKIVSLSDTDNPVIDRLTEQDGDPVSLTVALGGTGALGLGVLGLAVLNPVECQWLLTGLYVAMAAIIGWLVTIRQLL